MEFKLAPLSDFIRSSDRSPLSRKEYSALAHPNRVAPEATSTDTVQLSSDNGRQALINSLTSGFSAGGNALFNSLTPANNGLGGLYAGVGQLSPYQIKSLIDDYV